MLFINLKYYLLIMTTVTIITLTLVPDVLSIFQKSPAITAVEPFNPEDDAKVIKQALSNLKIDGKDKLIQLLTRRTKAQRLKIVDSYKNIYQTDITDDIEDKLSKQFKKLIFALITPVPEFYARELRKALEGLGTDEEALIEILCTILPTELNSVKTVYETNYGKSLQHDIDGDTSGIFQRILLALINNNFNISYETNIEEATYIAQKLYEKGEQRNGTDESIFIRTLCSRNYAQLKLIFKEYDKIAGHDLEVAIKKEFSGNDKEALLAIIRYTRNPARYFAKRLHIRIQAKNHRAVSRIIVARSEIDIGAIKKEFFDKYSVTLSSEIEEYSTGSHKRCLIALIGDA